MYHSIVIIGKYSNSRMSEHNGDKLNIMEILYNQG